MRRRRAPAPPVNIRAVSVDGVEIPVDSVYVGREAGIAVWQVQLPEGFRAARILADEIPPMTALRVVYVLDLGD